MPTPEQELFGADLNDPLSGLLPESEQEVVSMNNPFPEPTESGPDLDKFNYLDALAKASIDPEALAKKEQELYLPTSTYLWREGKCTVRISSNDSDKSPSDVLYSHNKGRCMFNVFGIVVSQDTKHTGRFSFSCSPDTRKRRDNTGKMQEESDLVSKNYALVTDLFFQKYERKPSTELEVVVFLESGLYSMYVTRGQRGNFLNQLKAL